MTQILINDILEPVCVINQGGNYMAAKHTKKKKTTRGRPKKEQQNQEIRGEIIILIALAVCILLVLSNFGMGGIVGEAGFICSFRLVWYYGLYSAFCRFWQSVHFSYRTGAMHMLT